MALRIIFMGTPDFSVPTLRRLAEAGHDIIACYTQPPRPSGRRGLTLKPSPVHETAEELNIPVSTPTSLRGESEREKFAAHAADVAVVVAYGQILPKLILETPRLGCFNGHASLLPRWRGAAPIQRAIMAGDTETGMMIMQMDAGLDTGPVALSERVAIDDETTAGELHDRLAQIGAELMSRAMAQLEDDSLELKPQGDDGVTYAEKISKEETRIDWNRDSRSVARHINGLSPFPGAWCEWKEGSDPVRLKLLKVRPVHNGEGEPGRILDGRLTIACGDGAVEAIRLQKAGSKAMTAQDFLAGSNLGRGDHLS